MKAPGASLDDVRESARFEVTRYCLSTYGGSAADWTVDPATGDETENFDSVVEGTFDDGTGSPQPVVLTGPVTTVVRGKGGSPTGSWPTEILSMSLTGDVGG